MPINNNTLLRPHTPQTHRLMLALATVAMMANLLSACATSRVVTNVGWLPDDADDWEVHQTDAADPPRWVSYARDALVADVREIRVVGLVDAAPEVVAKALRQRLVGDDNVPEGMVRKLVRASEDEVEFYALNPMPFPFDDREVNERLRFAHDPASGIHTVDVQSVHPGGESKPGVLRIPMVHNRFVIAPADNGQSIVTMDSVHDLGGNFPNWTIYGPVADFMVEELAVLNALANKPPDNSR